MISVLGNRTYRHLFAAQVLSLIGSGLTTVALGLVAYQLAGADAGAVLGTALAPKMIAYVGLAPVAGALAEIFARRPFLVALDLVRAALVLFLPLVTEIWQVYLLVFLFQACSAAFTPTFQATIMAVAAAAGAVAAARLWPNYDPEEIPHVHADIEHVHGPAEHAHHEPRAVACRDPRTGRHRRRKIRHTQRFVIDDHHPAWPTR